MSTPEELQQNLANLREEFIALDDTIKGIGQSINDDINVQISILDESTSAVDKSIANMARSFSKDLTAAINTSAKSLDNQDAIINKIKKGVNATKDIEKEVAKIEQQKAVILRKAEVLKRNGVDVNEEELGLLLLSLDTQLENLDALQDQSDEAVRQRGLFANLKEILKENLNTIDKTGNLSKLVEFKNAMADGDGLKLIMIGLVKAMLQGSSAIADIRKQTGLSYGAARDLQLEFHQTAKTSEKLFVTSKDISKAFAEISAETGIMGDFGGDTLVTFTSLNKQLGLSEKSAANLSMFARLQGKDTEKVLSDTVSMVSARNKEEKAAINVKDVLKEVADASKSIVASLGASPEKLAAAAREATKLGVSLNDIDATAESLLDFEQSIANELEAELLTGKSLNLEKARQFALTNDLEGLSKEIASNEEIIGAFSSQNRIQQQAVADSLGMSRDQLAQMALQQEYLNLSAEQFKEEYGEATYESMQAQSATDKFASSIEKVQGILGEVGTILAPVIDGFAFMVGAIAESKTGLTIISGVIAGIAAFQATLAIKSMIGAVAEIFKGSFMAGPFGLPLAIAGVAALGGAVASISSMAKADDIMSPGYGKRVLSAPEGTFALNDNDTVVAGTDLNQDATSPTSPASVNLSPMVSELAEIKNILNQLLNREGTVMLDGSKVGTALAIGNYKTQ